MDELLRKAVIIVARKNGFSMRQSVEVLAKCCDISVELLSAAMDLFEDDFDAKADTRDSEELAELEENKLEPPYLVFFVRTVPHHLIPWYTSGFQ